MSNPYVTDVTFADNQIVLTVLVDEFESGESIEISGQATQNGGAFAVFYDVQPVPERSPDGAVYIYVKALQWGRFRRGQDVTVVLRTARVWATVLGESQSDQGPSVRSVQYATPQGQAEWAPEGTAWNVRKAEVQLGAGTDPWGGLPPARA